MNNTRNYKEFLQAAVFVLLFLAILLPVSYMVRTNGDVKDRFAGFYAEKKDSLDVVMIGSSPVFPYYAAPKLWGEAGIAMYPLSTNVQRPAAMRYLMEEAEKTQSPALYIFEMRMFTMEEAGLMENMAYTRGVTDNLRYSPQRIRTIQGLVPEDDEEGRLSYYIDIMKYANLNQSQLALKIGKSQSSIANKIRLLNLDDNIQNAVNAKLISERHARALLGADAQKQQDYLDKILKKGLSVSQTERMIKADQNEGEPKKRLLLKGVTRNMKIALNTIHQAVKMVEKTGVDIQMKEAESDDEVIVTLRFHK